MGISGRRIRVLIVDDSAVVRQILARELSSDPEIEIVGSASDPYIARAKILREKPDVLTLDIEMPKMDGLTFLKKLMVYCPMPVIVLSSLAEAGSKVGLEALECGAVEVVAKPNSGVEQNLKESVRTLIDSIKAVAGARVHPGTQAQAVVPLREKPQHRPASQSPKIITMGASTGGTEALRTVLAALPPDSPGIAAVIHMPEVFTKTFAERLNRLCAIEVREARDGDILQSGLALIAPGGRHLLIAKKGGRLVAEISNGPAICRQRPSVEVLFQSVSRSAGAQAMGIIMTGMGADGAGGLLEMRNAGAYTVAQDEESCVVFGMPKEAIRRGAAMDVLPLDRISSACTRWSGMRSQTLTSAETNQ
jgi:two-component system, chemotaxis family, protein-glutamate methylesterase/glutaminase